MPSRMSYQCRPCGHWESTLKTKSQTAFDYLVTFKCLYEFSKCTAFYGLLLEKLDRHPKTLYQCSCFIILFCFIHRFFEHTQIRYHHTYQRSGHCSVAHQYQRSILKPIKYLWWSFFRKHFSYFRQKLHHRCLIGS